MKKIMAEENLGLYVMTRRKALGFKQSDLASALGYTSQAISKFESGESQIALEVLPKLANLLSLSLDDLLLENPNPAPLVQPNPDFSLATVKANLVALRANALLSQEQEALALGVSKRSIVSYEQGVSYPNFYCLSALLRHYQIKPSLFFYTSIPFSDKGRAFYEKRSKKAHLIWLGGFALLALTLGIALPLALKPRDVLSPAPENSSSSEETWSGPWTFSYPDASTSSSEPTSNPSSSLPNSSSTSASK